MRIVPPLLALLLLLDAGAAHAQATDSASSSIEIRLREGAAEAHIVNRRFIFDSRWRFGGEGPVRLMLEVTTDVTERDDAEGYSAATVAATAWQVAADGRRHLWSLTEPGDQGDVSHGQPLFMVRQSGCCGARNSFTAFNLDSGRRLFTATGESFEDCWALLEVPNSGGLERFVAFHAAYSATDEVAFEGRQDVIGLLTYASPTAPLARYRLVATGGSVESFMGGAQVELQQQGKTDEAPLLTLWPADGKRDPKVIGGFAIRLHLTEDRIVSIPVVADELVLASARLPAGIAIEPAPLP
jgi:hypothetical protein